MSSRCPAAFALAAVLAVPFARSSPAAADEPAGTRVRVIKKGSDERVVGRLVGRNPERLSIETDKGRGPVQIPYSQVARVQVSDGRNRSRGAWIGAGIGLVVAGAVYAIAPSDCSGSDCTKRFAFMAAPSMAVGALAGLQMAPEQWRDVSTIPNVTSLDRSKHLRIAVLPARGGVAAMASLAF